MSLWVSTPRVIAVASIGMHRDTFSPPGQLVSIALHISTIFTRAEVRPTHLRWAFTAGKHKLLSSHAQPGPQGPSQGDIRVLNAPLYDESGKERIGRFDLFCAITDPADESSEKAHIAECTKTFTLPGGQISVQGVEAYPNLSGLSPGVNAISGGTGKYAGVGGEQRFELRGKKVIDTFHFID